MVLNASGADILELCDGRRTVAEIVAELGARYQTVPDDEVQRFLTRLVARRCVEISEAGNCRWIAPSACWPSSPTAARWPARTAPTR